MAKTLTDFQAKVTATIQDDASSLSSTEKDLFLDEAVRIYSKDKPYQKIHEDDGDNSYEYDLPVDWNTDVSNIISRIEYPDEGSQEPQYIDDNDWMIYKTATAEKLRFLSESPKAGYGFRYTYTLSHILTASANTVLEVDFDAVSDLASSLCCRALAAKYAQTEEPTITADVIDYARKSDDYTRLADFLEQLYNKHMGKGLPKEALEKPGAMAVKDLDIEFPFGHDYFSHPKRLR